MGTWPKNVDGDVFRRLEANNFDFMKKYTIDFNVDFETWPPSEEAIQLLKALYPDLKVIDRESNNRGYIEVHVFDHLTYELVMEVQAKLSSLMNSSKGWCNSWGVWQG